MDQKPEISLGQRAIAQILPRQFIGRIPQNGTNPCVGILNVKHRIIAGLLDNSGKIKVQRRVVFAGQHDEPHDVLAHLVDHFTQGDKGPCPFGHGDRFTVAEQLDHLAQLDVQRAFPAGNGVDGRLHAFHVTTVIRPPHVDHLFETTVIF